MQLTGKSAKSIQISFNCLSNVRSNFEILATARYPDWSNAHRFDIYQPGSKSLSYLHSWNSWQFTFWISEKWFEGPHQMMTALLKVPWSIRIYNMKMWIWINFFYPIQNFRAQDSEEGNGRTEVGHSKSFSVTSQ